MQQPHPNYRINYLYCKEPNHSDQKTNLVCLNQDCQQTPLICSFCQEQKHKGHQTKPLKHFLTQLRNEYAHKKNTTFNEELIQLEKGKIFWLDKIQTAVDTLALAFMQLEQEIIRKYELLKNQIFEREAKRARFAAFYESMATQAKGDHDFEIQNYLQFQPLEVFRTPDAEIDFSIQCWRSALNDMKRTLTDNKKGAILPEQGIAQVKETHLPNLNAFSFFIVPPSIKRIGYSFVQMFPGSKQTLGYLNVILKDWVGMLKLKIINLQPNSKLALGVAKLTQVTAAKTIEQLKSKPNVFYFDSTGASQLQEFNHITSLKAKDKLTVIVKKNKFKIVHDKSMVCAHQIDKKEDTVMYFSLEGACEVEMMYPVFKVSDGSK